MPVDLLRSLPKTKAAFIEPMDCLPVPKLPQGSEWVWEIKLDGYRAVAVKSGDAITLYSRNRKILNKRFPYIVEPLGELPDGTVVDGEIVALDDDGRPFSICFRISPAGRPESGISCSTFSAIRTAIFSASLS